MMMMMMMMRRWSRWQRRQDFGGDWIWLWRRMEVFVVFSLSNALGAFTIYIGFDEAEPPPHGTGAPYGRGPPYQWLLKLLLINSVAWLTW